MLLFFCLIFLGIYFFSTISFHTITLLLLVEVFVLFCFLFMVLNFSSWYFGLMFLLFCVCSGSYGVSLLVSNSRSKGFSYFLTP